MMMEIYKKSLHNLKDILDFNNYSYCVSLVYGEGVYYSNPLPDYNSVLTGIKKLPQKMQNITKFFALGMPVMKFELISFLGENIIEHMKNLDLLNYDDEYVWLNNLILISYINCYAFVGNVYYYPTCQSKEQIPYIGPDSYWLSRMICNYVSGNVLDLCSGSGIQAILAAQTSNKVIAVDLDSRATNMIEINACLNKLEDKIEVRNGDLFEVVQNGELFDYIVANPPFIPIPSEVSFPLAGDGGEYGDSIIKRILEKGLKCLRYDGELLMIGQTLGDADAPYLTKAVKKYINFGSVNLTYHSKTLIEHQAYEFAKLSNILNRTTLDSSSWLENYNQVGATHFFNFLLKIKKNNTNILYENYFDDSWLNSDVPILKSSWKKAYENYAVSSNGKHSVIVDEEVVAFLKVVDGNRTIEEIVESMPFKYKIRYGENARIKMISKYMVLCSFLEHHSIILKSE